MTPRPRSSLAAPTGSPATDIDSPTASENPLRRLAALCGRATDGDRIAALLDVTRDYLGFGGAFIARAEPAADRWEIVHTNGDTLGIATGTLLSPADEPLGFALTADRPILVENVAAYSRGRVIHLASSHGIGALAIVPIVLRDGTVYGVLGALDHAPVAAPDDAADWVLVVARLLGDEIEHDRFRATMEPHGTRPQDTAEPSPEIDASDAENGVLVRLATGAPLPEILTALCLHLDQALQGGVSSIAQLDESGTRLRPTVAPNAPTGLIQAIESLGGIPVGPRDCSCGTAVHGRHPVITESIGADPLWTGYAPLAQQVAIEATWSVPIPDPGDGALLGAVSIYHAERRRPSATELALVEQVGRLAAVAILTRRAEERLRESELWYRSLVELLPAVVYTLEIAEDGGDRQLRYVSPRIETLLGVSPEAVLGDAGLIASSIHPADRDAVLAAVREARHGGRPFTVEYRLVRPDGEIRWVRDEAGPVTGTGDQQTLWQGVLLDITAQRTAEAAVRTGEARIGSLIRHAADLTAVLDREGNITYVTSSAERLLGFAPAELIGVDVFTLIHPDDIAAAREIFPIHRPHGEPSGPIELRARHRDGSWRWFEAVLTNLLADPAVQGIVANAHDVTDRIEAAARVTASEERLQTALTAANMAIWDWDLATGAIVRSAGMAALFGLPPGALADPLADPLVHVLPEDRHLIDQADAHHLATGDDYAVEYRVRWPDGSVHWLREQGHAVSTGEPAAQRLLGVTMDITAQKTAEAALRSAEARFRTLVEQLPGVVYIEDLDSKASQRQFPHSYVSPQVEHLFGYTATEWEAGDGLWEASLHPEDRERVLALDQRTEETGEPFRSEYRIVSRDGEVKWVRDEAVLIRDGDGQPLYWQGLQIDVTEQKRIEERLSAAEARYRHLVERLPAVTYLTEVEGPPVVYISPQIEQLLGYPVEDWYRDAGLWTAILHPDDRQAALDALKRSLTAGEQFRLTYRVIARDGRIVWIRDETLLIHDDHGRPLYRQGLIIDITAQQEAETALRRSEQEFRLVFAANPHPMWIFDNERLTFLEVNDAAVREYGYERDEFLRMTTVEILPEEERERLQDQLAAARAPQERSGEWQHRLKGGRIIDVEVTSHAIDFRGRPATLVVAVDVTDRKALAAQLAHQAFHDPLTGLPNRALFLDRLGHALRRAADHPDRLAVLFLDLDDFKRVNDTLGHGIGDDLLIAVAERFRACLRPGDTVARLGGDEFTFLLEDLESPEAAPAISERIAKELRPPFRVADREIFVTFSAGIASPPGPGTRAEDLLRSADVAMYAAKRGGRARYAVFEQAMDERAWKRLELEADLRRAVIAGEFRLHFQPIVSLIDGRVLEYEALVRWNHPTRGLISPNDFIPLAEETGLIVPLGRWVLEEACRWASTWGSARPSDPPPGVAVNLSARQLQEPELVTDVADVLARSGLAPNRLTLEITETTAVEDMVGAAAVVRKLRALGVRLAIDDFGAGYSGLSYLRRCPVDALKIDRAYVARLDQDAGDVAMVRAVLAFAHSLGLRVIAEGVETAEQLAHLKSLGCESAQGNYFARPATVEAIARLVTERG